MLPDVGGGVGRCSSAVKSMPCFCRGLKSPAPMLGDLSAASGLHRHLHSDAYTLGQKTDGIILKALLKSIFKCNVLIY